MKATFLILAALIGAPAPAPAYRQPIGGETAAAMLDTIISNQGETAADPAEDYNGDGFINIADYTSSARRHYINTHEHTEITIDAEAVEAIAAELYPDDIQIYFYYEIDMIDGSLCREYEITADEITSARIYFEFADYCTTVRAEINPKTESITIIKED